MMKSTILGPTSNEWFKFGEVKDMSTTKDSISFTNGDETVVARLASDGGVFVTLPEKHVGSNVSTVQRVKVEMSRGEDGVREQVTTWQLLFDDKHRELFTTKLRGSTPYDVLSNPLTWTVK